MLKIVDSQQAKIYNICKQILLSMYFSFVSLNNNFFLETFSSILCTFIFAFVNALPLLLVYSFIALLLRLLLENLYRQENILSIFHLF